MKCYIAGPMRHIPNFNFPAFDAVADYMRRHGWEVYNPAEHDRDMDPTMEQQAAFATGDIENLQGFSFSEAMRWDLRCITTCDAIVFLPGWEKSTGAGHEKYVADVCGLEVLYAFPSRGASWFVSPTDLNAGEAHPRVIGLAGYAQAGKDTLGQVFVQQHGAHRQSFADKLRECLYALNPPVEVYPPGGYDGAFVPLQQVVDQRGWEWAKANTSARALLQRLGTDVSRNLLDEDVWVNAAMNDLKPGLNVFTDVRFPNEAAAIKAMGGEVWRVVREGTGPVNDHPSETALDDYQYDRTIFNNGTIGDLRAVDWSPR